MIRFDKVTVTYPDATVPALRDVDLTIPEGDLCLVVGRTGVGKSTLLGAINGLVPHFTGGTMSGRVTVDGRDTRDSPPRELAELVGVVVQDPIQGFVADIVEDELAYGMEQLAVPHDVMRKRVEETLDLLGLAELRRRPLRTLSGGQQQRVAIGSVLTSHPRVLVLDEPTSALDPAAAEDVLAALTRLVHDLGLTVVVAEHRLERVVEYADMVVAVEADGRVRSGDPRDMMASTEVAPPIVRLGRSLGWDPLPLSVREARRASRDLAERLAQLAPPSSTEATNRDAALSANDIVVRYGANVAVDRVDLSIGSGEVVALMGRNGSGKSSLLWALQGGGTRTQGTVALADGSDPADQDEQGRYGRITLVPQSPSDLLYLPTVAAECDAADSSAPDQPAGRCRRILDGIVPGIPADRHPRDLSEGQRLAVALAVQLTADPAVVMLDEPTRGLDEPAKARFSDHIRRLADNGRAVLVATHDVELVAAVADRVVVMADGEVVADGPTPEVVVSSPIFAPQVAKVLRPSPWLTAQQVTDALEADR